MFKNIIKEYFTFSLSTRRGIWVLIVLILIIFLIPYTYKAFIKDDYKIFDHSEIIEFTNALTEIKKQNSLYPLWNSVPFDPNKLLKTEWIKRGVSYKTANNIEKYIKNGGYFYKKEDILKIYGFDSILYQKLSPFFIFPKNNYSIKYQKNTEDKFVKINKLELNTVDSVTLESLPGIGKTLSARIIKYRNLLGGFYKYGQLLEVYGFSNKVLNLIRNKVEIDSALITKIDLNNTTVQQLSKHPYIGKYQAVGIIKYRKLNGKIINYSELIDNGLISKDKFNKLVHYLK